MTTLEEQFKNNEQFSNWQKNQQRGRITTGVFLILASSIFLYKQMGYFVPEWLFTWPTLLICIGIISGIKHNFKNSHWIILILIGGLFLASNFFATLGIFHYKFPIILFIIGLVLIFKPKNKYYHYSKYKHKECGNYNTMSNSTIDNTTDDYILVNNVFSGTNKNVFSKDFKGGEIKNTFGGGKINLMQADIVNEAKLTVYQHFGGLKLVIPSNWAVKSDINCVFAGIEDKRPLVNVTDAAQTKTLILNGHIFMSGIEIVSY